MAGAMELAQMAGSILSAAAKIYQIVQEVRHFKQQSKRLEKRIRQLKPIVEKLASSDQKVPDHAKTPEGLKIFSRTLGEFLRLIQKSGDFIEKLQKKSFWDRWRNKNEITERFDEYSEELDSMIGTLQFGLAVEAREVMYKWRIKEDRNDQREDEASLFNEYEKDQEKILQETGKLKEGQEEIMKILEEMDLKRLQWTQNDQSSLSKHQSSVEGLQEINPKELTNRTKIASGPISETHRATYMADVVAFKSNPTQRGKYIINKDVKEILLKEAKTLLLLNSTFIVRLWGVCTKIEPYLLVFEFMSRGNLRDVLNEFGGDLKILPWERRIKMSLDGALGLYRMHNTRPSLLHQDLASDNFLVDENWRMKVSGVGFAKTQRSILKNSKQTRTFRSTLNYICPERLININLPSSASTDVYSYGIVMWEIATGKNPYEGIDTHKFVLIEKKKLQLPSDCPGGFKNLIDQCREFDPLKRPTSNEIVNELQKCCE